MFNRLERRCTRTTIMTADQHIIGVGLGNTCRDGAYPRTRNQLDAYACLRVDLP